MDNKAVIEDNNIQERCKGAANMVVDALVDAGLLREADADKAIAIAEEELIVRKAIRKL